MKCTDVLLQDHKLLRRALDVLEAMVHKLERSERIEIADAVTVIRFIKIFGIQYHQIMEESVVFPALLRDAEHDSTVRSMLFEHTEQQDLISAVEEGLQLRKGIQFVRNAHGLIALMRTHLDREDGLLRSLGETWLAKDEDDVVLSALTQRRMQTENVGIIPTLESKYMPKQFAVPLDAQRPLSRAQGSAAH
jgi:hemerythrin-like domain-containing protein